MGKSSSKKSLWIRSGAAPQASCPSCGHELSGFTSASETRGQRPYAGAPTLCCYCGALLVFDARSIPRRPTPEMAERLLREYPLVRRLQTEILNGMFSMRGRA